MLRIAARPRFPNATATSAPDCRGFEPGGLPTTGRLAADMANLRDGGSLDDRPSHAGRAPRTGPPSGRALTLATISFALSFAAWGLVGGLASIFTRSLRLTASQTALLVAVPVLLGSLARLPMGMLTDRFGGRAVFSPCWRFSSLAAWLVPLTTSYPSLLSRPFFLGLAGSSFSIGAAFVSRWTPPARQGTALGHLRSRARWDSRWPCLAARWPPRASVGRRCFGVRSAPARWSGPSSMSLLARNPPHAARPASVAAMVAVLRREPTAWLLGAFYFLTFGGFVAFSIYLPTLLRAQFGLAPADAGFRAAGFVVLATLMRPVGGWLADRIGGAQVLSWVFGGVAGFALLLTWPSMVPVHGRRARVRAAAGTGQRRRLQARARALSQGHRNRHRPGRRARRPGRVLPAAAAGRVSRSARRALAGLPAAFADGARPARRQPARVPARRRRVDAWRCRSPRRRPSSGPGPPPGPRSSTAGLAVAIVVGSRNLQHFDAALVGYTFATLFAAFGITLPLRDVAESAADAHVLAARVAGVLLAGARWPEYASASAGARSWSSPRIASSFGAGALRGLAHWLIMWGCLLAAAITFPAGLGLDPLRDRARRPAYSIARSCSASPVQDFPVESLWRS